MVTLFTDERMLDHHPPSRTPSGPSGSRRSSATSTGPGFARRCSPGSVREATDEELLRVHSHGVPRSRSPGSS